MPLRGAGRGALSLPGLRPLLDRIDIHLEVPAVVYSDLVEGRPEEPSAAIRERVERTGGRGGGRLTNSK